jgi:uncharacterized protein (TIGR03663 family)
MNGAASAIPLIELKRGPRFLLAAAFAVTLAIGAATRAPRLDLRPMHGDEANQAVKTGHLYDHGVYAYDPLDHHGPTLYYLAALSARLAGHDRFADTTESTYRIVPVIFGLALLILPWGLRSEIGSSGAAAASLLLAVSPAFAFYSRYFIQEMLLVFFTGAAIVCAARYFRSPSLSWAIAAGACAGLMHATKETCVIAFASLAVAGLCVFVSRDTSKRNAARQTSLHILAAITVALAVSVVLFSSFFTNARGPLDSILTYGNYIQRADGAGIHDRPWHHYLWSMIFIQRDGGPWWSEGLILALAIAGCVIAWRDRRAAFPRFLAVFTVLTTLAYSTIPYKTPWSALSMMWAMAMLGGWAAARMISSPAPPWIRAAVATVLAAGCIHLGAQAYRANFEKYADLVNPYVYAHTSTAITRLVDRAHDLAAIHPDGYGMEIAIVEKEHDYWPLPWYLRKFSRVGYWESISPDLNTPLIIASGDHLRVADPPIEGDVVASLFERYMVETHGLRPSVLRMALIENGLWERFMEDRR